MVVAMITFLSTCLCLILLSSLIWFLHKLWWTPIYIQYVMRSQGIKGPSYKFLHGNTKEILKMIKEASSRPMDSSHDIYPRLQPHIYSWIKLYGNNFLSWYGPQALLIVTELELIKEILNNKDGAYPKSKLRNYSKKLLGDGLVATEGEKWSKLRKLSNHTFHAESLKGMVPAMVATVEGMLERWRHHEGKDIEVYEEFRLLTSEVISRTAFGSSYLEGENIFEVLMNLGAIISRTEYKIRFPGAGKLFKSSDDIESEEKEKAIRDSVLAIIQKREKKVMTGEAESFGSDFLGILINAKHEDDEKKRLSVEELIDECKTFYFAGQETTTSILSWTIFLLAVHTDWQDKARKEVLDLFAHENPNPEGISRLKTTSMIINETLRLYSPVVSIFRRVKEGKVRLGKFILPADVKVLIPTLALHHNTEIWGKDAHLFKPQRFAEGVTKATNNNTMAYLPFGYGPRTCVGLNFASTEAKIALSMILQRYKFTLSPTYVHSPFQVITVRPQHGVQILLQEL